LQLCRASNSNSFHILLPILASRRADIVQNNWGEKSMSMGQAMMLLELQELHSQINPVINLS